MELWDYQKEAVDFITSRPRAFLALDMGMGKTITSLYAMKQKAQKHILLVAEKNEIVNSKNFEREAHMLGLGYHCLRNIKNGKIEVDWGIPHYRTVCGANPDLLSKMSDTEVVKHFDSIIVDESTFAKTITTKTFKELLRITQLVPNVVLLSGTPMMNGSAELFAPLVILQHPMVHNKNQKFAQKAFDRIFAGGHYRQIRNTGKWFQDYQWWNKGANNSRELRYLLQSHFFVRTKEGTGVFRKKTRKIEKVPMTISWMYEYQKAWDEYFKDAKRKQKNLENITELRRLIENGQCYQVNSKYKAIKAVDDIASGMYGDQRIIIFSLYKETDNIIQRELTAREIKYKTFEGLSEWKKGNEQVLVGRIKSHNKGGNVPEASVCLFVDMDFVPAQNIQAENRIDRPEQKNDMTIVYYMTDGIDVIDEHIRRINAQKQARITNFMRPLTAQELAEMPQKLATLRNKFPEDCRFLGI